MSGQLPDWFWFDWLWFELPLVLEVVAEPEEEDEELQLAAFAIAAPPPATIPTAATVASPIPNRLMTHHLLSHLADDDESTGAP
jgi:hypothetical protein